MTLSDIHRAYLTEHAITDAVIEGAGIFSEGEFIGFPFRDGELTTVQWRPWPEQPGGLDAKYLWESGKPLHLAAWRPARDDGGPVIIAEGTKQALAVASWAQEEYAVYGMQGISGWVNTDLSRFADRDVTIIADQDASTNPDVYTEAEKLGRALEVGGARPRFATSPGRAKDGVDDFLAKTVVANRGRVIANLIAMATAKPATRRPRRPAAKRSGNLTCNGTVSAGVTAGNGSDLQSVGCNGSNGPPADGCALLDEMFTAISAYVVLPTPDHTVAVTLFTAVTHAAARLQVAPRLRVTSPVKQCGKTRLLEVLEPLVRKPLPTANVSAAALVRSIGDDPCTMIIDEMDTVFAKTANGDEKSEALRGILNAGFGRGKPYIRYNALTGETEKFPTFAMAVLAGIGDLPDTIEDRSIIISMRRKTGEDKAARFRLRRDVPALRNLGARLGAWIGPLAESVGAAEPPMPDGLADRAEDLWEPLIAVADLAGGRWPGLARGAALALLREKLEHTYDVSTRLLEDLRDVFGNEEALWSSTIVTRLNSTETSPWPGWHSGRGITTSDLAAQLRPLRIRPRGIRVGETVLKGYRAEDFSDAWRRYASGGAVTAVTAETSQVRPQMAADTLPTHSRYTIRNPDQMPAPAPASAALGNDDPVPSPDAAWRCPTKAKFRCNPGYCLRSAPGCPHAPGGPS